VDACARRQGGDEVVFERFTEEARAVLVKALDVIAPGYLLLAFSGSITILS
jgi:hypothetical protein